MKTKGQMKTRESTLKSSGPGVIPHSAEPGLIPQSAIRNPQSDDAAAFTVEDSAPEYRPWGNFRTLGSGPGYKIKRLVINPGHRLSLQKHMRRAEHWVIVSGTATLTRGDRRFSLRERQCAVIPRLAWHRVENRGHGPLVIIEVQHGTYLGEDDIVRKADDYGRIK